MNPTTEQMELVKSIAASRSCTEQEALSFALKLAEECERGKALGDMPIMWCVATGNNGMRPLKGYGGPTKRRGKRLYPHD